MLKPIIEKYPAQIQTPQSKKIAILGGVHGNELTPVYAVGLLIKKLNEIHDHLYDENILNHNIIIFNGINIDGLRQCERDIPKNDTNDINRKYPKPFNIDEYLDNDLFKKSNDFDVVIDVHSSPNCLDFCLVNIDENTMMFKKFFDELDIPTGYRYHGGNTIKKYFNDIGKLGITMELNGIDLLDHKSANIGVEMILNIISNINKLKFNPADDRYEMLIDIIPLDEIKSNKEGIIDATISPGKIVTKNITLGVLYDFCGNIIHNIKYPHDKGIIITGPDKSYVAEGSTIYMIQQIK